MKALRNYLDSIKPHFKKGGKFEKFHSTFDAFETFLFVPDKVTKAGSHLRDAIDLKRTMSVVVLALLPALFFGIWNVGHQYFLSIGADVTVGQKIWYGVLKVFPIIVVSYVTGLGIEFVFAQLRGHEVNEGFLVSGMLIPLIMPVNIPLWMVALATAFAVIIGKEVFGGTGMNVFNPALIARAFLFFSYPADMSGDLVWVDSLAGNQAVVDGFTGSTPLGQAAIGQFPFVSSTGAPLSLADMFFGFIPGSIGETSTLAILIGAVILLVTGVGSWKIMLSVFAGGLFMGGLFNMFPANEYMKVSAIEHICLGGFAFGAVFMATDPVTGAQTSVGKYIYGFLIGLLAILIRVLNPAYPEGMMLAILLMNVFAPLIDYYVVQSNINRRLKRARIADRKQ